MSVRLLFLHKFYYSLSTFPFFPILQFVAISILFILLDSISAHVVGANDKYSIFILRFETLVLKGHKTLGDFVVFVDAIMEFFLIEELKPYFCRLPTKVLS